MDLESTADILDQLLAIRDPRDPQKFEERHPITAETIAAAPVLRRIVNLEPALRREALSAITEDLGKRLLRVFLKVGSWHAGRRSDTSTARNYGDTLDARMLLDGMAVELNNVPIVPDAVVELITHVVSALDDGLANRKPVLFEHDVAQDARRVSELPGRCRGRLAAALEMLTSGGMKPREAKAWLDTELLRAGLVDRAGGPIRAQRVADDRNHYAKGTGAAMARRFYEYELDDRKALRGAPPGQEKVAKCIGAARELIYLAVRWDNRTASPPAQRALKL